MHETFINKSFIAIDVFNGEKYEIVLWFFQFNILQLLVCYSTFLSFTLSLACAGVSYMRMFSEWAKYRAPHQIFITEWNKWNKSKIEALHGLFEYLKCVSRNENSTRLAFISVASDENFHQEKLSV
jgi:hypothetical protein